MMIRKFLFLFVLSTFMFSCSENSPVIPCLSCEEDGGGGPIDSIVKKVLIEEFTGVQCVNCPQGSAEIENLISIHGDKLIAISIHAGFFSDPYPESAYDFRTADGDNLETFLGPLSFFPIAVVDRNLFDGEPALVVGQSAWSSYIAQQLDEAPSISVDLQTSFNDEPRELSIDVSGVAQTDLAHDIYLTVIYTESNVVDYQKKPEGKVSDYVHKHIYRDALTPFNGMVISSNLNAGDSYEQSFSYTIPDEWDINNSTIIAYIHRNDTEKTVLQVEENKLSE